jgi:hypothetical protein
MDTKNLLELLAKGERLELAPGEAEALAKAILADPQLRGRYTAVLDPKTQHYCFGETYELLYKPPSPRIVKETIELEYKGFIDLFFSGNCTANLNTATNVYSPLMAYALLVHALEARGADPLRLRCEWSDSGIVRFYMV